MNKGIKELQISAQELEENREKTKLYHVAGIDYMYPNLLVIAKNSIDALEVAKRFGEDAFKDKVAKDLNGAMEGKLGSPSDLREEASLMVENHAKQKRKEFAVKKVATQLVFGVFELDGTTI